MPEPKQLPPAFSRLLSSVGCRANNSYVPCVLCQGGYNSFDHWLSFCPVVHLTWLALWAAPAPEINWRIVPSRSIGVALCYTLFHLRRLVTEYGGLRPNIACVRHCSISHHVLDLWQRIYSSLPSTLLNHFRAPPQPSSTACTDSTKIRTQRFPAVLLEADLQRLSPLLKEIRLLLLLSRITASVCSFHNTESFPFPQQPHASSPFHATAGPRTCVCKPWTICLQILSSC